MRYFLDYPFETASDKQLDQAAADFFGMPVVPLFSHASRPARQEIRNGFRKSKKGGYFLHLEVPGLKAENLDIEFRDGGVLVQGKTPESEEGFHKEVKAFFPLPEDADADKIQAALNDGVLTLRVPVKGSAANRKISIG